MDSKEHNMLAMMKLGFERFYLKQQVQKLDNMQGVSLMEKFRYEVMSVMAETHAAQILEGAWMRPFVVENKVGGGRVDFVCPDSKRKEIKVSEFTGDIEKDSLINLNQNSNKQWDEIVKFTADINLGITWHLGWATATEYFEKGHVKLIERPNGRGYYQGHVRRNDYRWTRG